ncbi:MULTISPECIES: carboxynorspermidine decarboxylase [Idiomarinaceae]|uniref:Carboxynorspermidine/carboxyspermidine decarboxylase n=3 Tax=Pseudidiomarina TaxID=2800384 RepID=A0A368UNE8_9GAMM|nr:MULTISPECIES: carboxynorspermidine decarboxylase [Idiomarinaceae]MRJ43029.1 carboxynorspermidine decarboxylase [Idiomarina sp. FeN1]NCU58211.1 carboxynorspermidine decarboxylase [Idiomarina sp. FenA--70]NCU60909.1 carboxynorspermidine decarboxylase [Idiomarina sp. FenBw--71]PWW10628.1 carboxynorspermidine decarboxylase [Pseudidiomarina maritima]RBP88376.1 carboxynorspermidine decarboxylase [Pseudidiomarina tainanensis]
MSNPYLDNAIPSPCYVCDEALLVRNLELMQRVQQESGAHIILALKGFSMWSTFPVVRNYLRGCTASSVWEARLASEEFGREVHAYAPAYKPADIDALLPLVHHISFNSLSQWQRYKEQTLAAGVSAGLRINPEHQEAETELYDPSAPGSRLGIRLCDLEGADLSGIEGLHVHNLCECDSFALERTLTAVESKFGHLLHQMKWLNLGGGHLMTRAGYDVEHLIKQLKRLQETYKLQVILEPGSAVAWRTGPLVAEVVDIVENDGQIAILDISATAHMPDVLEMPYRPMVTGADEAGKLAYTYKLGGNSCLAGDVIGAYSFAEPLQPGDRLIFEDMMHYTMVKTTFFNGVEHPSIGILRSNGEFELIRKFTYEDFRDKLS